jgi:hypothetical protein
MIHTGRLLFFLVARKGGLGGGGDGIILWLMLVRALKNEYGIAMYPLLVFFLSPEGRHRRRRLRHPLVDVSSATRIMNMVQYVPSARVLLKPRRALSAAAARASAAAAASIAAAAAASAAAAAASAAAAAASAAAAAASAAAVVAALAARRARNQAMVRLSESYYQLVFTSGVAT